VGKTPHGERRRILSISFEMERSRLGLFLRAKWTFQLNPSKEPNRLLSISKEMERSPSHGERYFTGEEGRGETPFLPD
jgi:hypothetical protein